MNYLRNVVSGPKARHVSKADGVDLDLVYLTDRIILMGYPASGIESSYRNRMSDVVAFLDAKHFGAYRVFNLCPMSENSYEPASFHGRVSRYPHPDHHPPPLPLLHAATQEMVAYLRAPPSLADGVPSTQTVGKNVVVIHCKAGKGRTGTLACCLLEKLGGVDAAVKEHGVLLGRAPGTPGGAKDDESDGEAAEGGSITGPRPTFITPAPSEEPTVTSVPPLETAPTKKHKKSKSKAGGKSLDLERTKPHPAAEAFAFHTSRRMHNPQSVKQGVSIPSQRRFVRYFHESLANLKATSPTHSTPAADAPHTATDVVPGPPASPSLYPNNKNSNKLMLRLKSIIVTQTSPVSASLTPKVRAEVSRYLDTFVDSLDETVIQNARHPPEPILAGAGGLGLGLSRGGQADVGGELEKAGGGMVRALGRATESFVEVGHKDFDEYGEATKTPLVTHHLTPDTPLILHPDRELKVQVLLGEHTGKSYRSLKSSGFKAAVVNVVLSQDTSSLGWIWLVPSFHLPALGSGKEGKDEEGVARTHTIAFPRELVDFRSKSMREVRLVFEEVPAEEAEKPGVVGVKAGGGGGGGEKGEVVPPEEVRETAETAGTDEKKEGGEYK